MAMEQLDLVPYDFDARFPIQWSSAPALATVVLAPRLRAPSLPKDEHSSSTYPRAAAERRDDGFRRFGTKTTASVKTASRSDCPCQPTKTEAVLLAALCFAITVVIVLVGLAASGTAGASGRVNRRMFHTRLGCSTTSNTIPVTELQGLNQIGGGCDTVIIFEPGWYEASDVKPLPNLLTNMGVRRLEILPNATMTFGALRLVLQALPKLQSLTFNLASSCDADSSGAAAKFGLGQGRKLELQTLKLSHAQQHCPTLEQIFNLKLSALQTLTISKSNLTRRSCRALEKLLQKSRRSLVEIFIEETFVADCDFREIQFPNLLRMSAF